jgi:hypothetical protein
MRATDNLATQLKLIMQLKHQQILNRLRDSFENGLENLASDDNKSTKWELQKIIDTKLPHQMQETLVFNKNIDPAVVDAKAEMEAAAAAFNDLSSKEKVIKLLRQ